MTSCDRGGALAPTDRPVRAIRSVAAALGCVTAAALGHLGAGGHLSGAAVLAVFAGSAGVVWMLSNRRVTTGQIIGLLVLCQAGVHLGGPDMDMNAAMLLGHVAATAASVLALARGEQFAWHIAERLGLCAAPVLRAVGLPVAGRPARPTSPSRAPHDVLLAHSRWLRGPPAESY